MVFSRRGSSDKALAFYVKVAVLGRKSTEKDLTLADLSGVISHCGSDRHKATVTPPPYATPEPHRGASPYEFRGLPSS